MAKVKSITLERAEGPTHECVEVKLRDYFAANAQLRAWSHTAPISRAHGGLGGYDKCDFTIEFEDGETYSGRYDLQRHMDEGLLQEHVQRFVKFHAGLYRPVHMTPESYENLLRQYGEETKKGFLEFLGKYDIGQA
jgi:hypothetical protein